MVLLLLGLLCAAPEAHPFAAAQDALAARAMDEARKNDVAASVRDAAQLVAEAKDNPRAWRVKGLVEVAAGHFDDAEAALLESLRLGIDKPRSADVFAMLGYARLEKKQRFAAQQARQNFQQALDVDPNHFLALYYLAYLQMEDGDVNNALRLAQKLAATHADRPEGHLLLAQLLLSREDAAGAREEIARTRKAGYANAEVLGKLEAAAQRLERRSLWWELPLAVVAAMALALLLLFVGGTLLSRAQVSRLADVHAHLVAAEQTASERLVLRLYSAVLWFGTVFFYVSVPGMVVISLATGLVLIWAMFASLPLIPIKLAAIFLVIALGGAWAVIRSLFLGAVPDTGELKMDETAEPKLFGALREVSDAIGSRMVDRVYIELGSDVAVREAGGGLAVLSGRGERVLHVGFWALQNLTLTELKSILAHEYGHFAHGETRLTPVIARIVNTLIAMLQRMGSLGRSTQVNPVYWYLRCYFKVFYGVTAGHSRRRELLADRAAALQYGGDVFGRALRSIVQGSGVFETTAGRLVAVLRSRGSPCTDLYACLRAARDTVPERIRVEQARPELERTGGKYDSHPPAHERIARVAGVPARRAEERQPALSLLSDPDAVARKLTAIVVERVERQVEVGQPERPMEPGAQELLAGAVALHDAALMLEEKEDPEGDALLISSLERLETALGKEDPLLAVPLKSLARAQIRSGRAADAAASLERAIALSRDENSQAEMQQMLRDLRPAA